MQDVARGIGLDNRIGAQVPACRPGLWRLVLPQGHAGADQDRAGLRARRCASSRRWCAVNDAAQARDGAQGHRGAAAATCAARPIAVLGLTFKPNTDDMRDAPSIAVIPALQDVGRAGPRLRSGRHGAGQAGADGRRPIATSAYDCAEGADALVIVTEWEQFRALDLDAAQDGDEGAGRRRSAQHLSRRRHGAARLYLRQHRPRPAQGRLSKQ